MKKILNSIKALSLLGALALTACSGGDDPEIITDPTDSVIANLQNGIMNGVLTESFILNANGSYALTGAFIVDEDATLTIPSGTQIIADAGGTDVYLAVLKGAKININGTGSDPVIMSSIDANPGDWGGLTICGKATTTAGIDATAEVGGFIYGGTKDNDNSGTIRNLVIQGTGSQINSESQYNGISFYAVGSETVVENIAVIDGSDDGVEFFGGTVNASNLYLENNEDDSVDWTEGWNGTVTNTYISHTKEGFSTAFEGDKVNNNPKFVNVTAISTEGGTALQFKKESGATITKLHLSGYDKNIDMKDNGPLENVKIDGENADPNATYNAEKIDISAWTWKNASL